jgi:hypothetical protein
MTDPKQAMQQALEALTDVRFVLDCALGIGAIRPHDADGPAVMADKAITALRAALSSIPDVSAADPMGWHSRLATMALEAIEAGPNAALLMNLEGIKEHLRAAKAGGWPVWGSASFAQKEPGETGMDERKTDGVTACPPVGQDVAFNEAERLVLELRNAVWQAQSLAETREAEDALMQFLRRAFGVALDATPTDQEYRCNVRFRDGSTAEGLTEEELKQHEGHIAQVWRVPVWPSTATGGQQ